MLRLPDLLRAFQSRNYRLYFMGQGISFLGTMMQSAAQGWLVYRLTDSAFWLGFVAFAGQLPAFFMAPIAGLLCDRLEKRRLLIAADALQMLQATLLAVLVLTGVVRPWHILALASVLGVASGFEMTTRHAMVPEIVEDPAHLGNAIALNSGMFNLGRIAGPSIAGFVVAWHGEGVCFALNAASYVAILYALVAMRLPRRPGPAGRSAPLRELGEGFRYATAFTPLRDIILLMAWVSLAGASAMVLMPVYARDILHGDARTLGFLMAAVGFGSILGAVYLASRRRVPGLGIVIALALAAMGLSLAGLAFVRSTPLALALLVVTGAGMMLHMSSSNTILQSVAEDHLRGRVMSFYIMAFAGFGPLGALLAGTAARHFGAPVVLVTAGVCTVAGAVVFACNLPAMGRRLAPVYVRKGLLPAGIPAVDTGLE